MQQGRDRRGRDHGRGQPVVERHQGRLGQAADIQGVGQTHQVRMLRHHVGGEHAGEHVAQAHVQGAAEHVGHDHGREQEKLGGTHEVDQVLARPGEALRVLVVGDQGIREDGDHLVEEVEREHVGREGHAHGAEDGHREAEVVAGLGVLVEPAHVAHVVAGGEAPEERGDEREDHAQAVGHEAHRDARQDREQRVGVDVALEHPGNERADGQEGHRGGDEGHGLALVHVAPVEPDGEGRHQGHRKGNEELGAFDCRGHGAIPSGWRLRWFWSCRSGAKPLR